MSEPRWDMLEVPDVRDVADQAARRVYSRFAKYVELEDLRQEALIVVATDRSGENPSPLGLHEIIRDRELGLLQHRLENALTWPLRTEVRRADKQVPYQYESDDESTSAGVATFIPSPALASDYNRETVEMLLPAVWNEELAYGLPRRDDAPDPDMPKGYSNKATSNNLPALIADIKVGYAKAPLTHRERRALLLVFGVGLAQVDAAKHEGVMENTMSERLFTAIGKIVARLNGGIWYTLEYEAA